jgi:hypothetical protein
MAREWAAVPEYRLSLEHTLGPGALDALIADLEARGAGLLEVGRTVFSRWLDRCFAAAPTESNARQSAV